MRSNSFNKIWECKFKFDTNLRIAGLAYLLLAAGKGPTKYVYSKANTLFENLN